MAMHNGTRARPDSVSSDDDEGSRSKRVAASQNVSVYGTGEAEDDERRHYDIYVVPSTVPVHSSLSHPSVHYQNASFVVVNRAAGLSALGVQFSLESNEQGNQLRPQVDPGFCLPRQPTYDAAKAVLVGWVHEEQLSSLERAVRSTPVPSMAAQSPAIPIVLEWILAVGHQLEMAGILANSDLILSDILQQR